MQKEKVSFQVIPNCPTQTGMNVEPTAMANAILAPVMVSSRAKIRGWRGIVHCKQALRRSIFVAKFGGSVH
jgi:hypothetical protein